MTRIELRIGVTLVGDAVGEGSDVLLLHAGGERRRVWAPVAQRLAAKGFRAVAYDLRGHGESDPRDAGSLRTHAQDVAAMVAAMPGRPVVVGASLGGLAALLALRDAIVRDRVAALVLVDVVPDPPGERVRAYLDRAAEGLADNPLVADVLTRRDELRAAAAGLVDEVPVMLVRGGGSPLGDDDARRLGGLVPDLRVSVVPRAGHLVARDAPAELAAAILEYLDDPAVRRRSAPDRSCAPPGPSCSSYATGREHVRLRPATRDDAAAIVRAFEWLFAPPGSKPPDWGEDQALRRTREVIADEDSDVLVAEIEGELVGFCSVALDLKSIRFGRRAWVEDLAVAPAHRSGGIGKALLDAAKAWARERGADHLELDSGDARVDAHRFYRREGASWESRCFGWVLDG